MKGVLDPAIVCRHLHQKYITNSIFLMGMTGFDRAISKDMDNTVGDDRKSSKLVNANDAYFGDERLAA